VKKIDAPPGYADAMNVAAEWHAAGKWEKATEIYNQCIGHMPEDSFALYMIGTMFTHMKLNGFAIPFLRNSVALDPTRWEAWHNLGVAYRMEEHSERALGAYAKGIAINDQNADLLSMMAGGHINEGKPERAVYWSDKALAIEPDNVHARNHKALALLEMGEYKEGWEYYSTRWEVPDKIPMKRHYPGPRWNGEKVGTLVIHGEQGLGDEVLFTSCIEDIRHLADNIVIECATRLTTLFERSFGVPCYAVETEIADAGIIPDAWVPMGDLPRFCRNKLEDFPGTPFLKADSERVKYWRGMMESQGAGPYVLLAYLGGTKATSQGVRNPPLSFWKGILKQDVTFISGQYTPGANKLAEEWDIPHWQESIDDLDEFAALVEASDLVISVCQTAIHFAGGLGKDCWCITPDKFAWRYSDGMPWYASVSLFMKDGDWGKPFSQIERKLADLARIHRAEQNTA